ncbi:phage capsid protein [Thermomonospora cellulosilytica]|uniref:P22 coat protein Gp5 n=1 Tax=Thermomonospora cellulosilytica TaxID=1411118 RepID=A0A7W3MU83_9ACTN|nr:phage capsid protein [Thermomonospora cellulosilytica]MBA9002016.1 hypothetical protein [Thermomonospora cellulosilytica]
MAVLTAQRISSLAVSLLTRSLVLPMTVSRVPGGEFAGDNGDTVTVRVRTPRAARVQATPGATITYDALNETPVDVSLTHLYDATRLTDEDMSLNIVDFGVQVTQPQVESVATGAEDRLAAAMNAVAADASFALTPSAADTDAKILQARETLSEANVPASDRFLACAPDIITRLLSVDKFVRADAVGDGTAIREAIVGRIYGFTVLESNGLAAGTAVAYHRSGFVFANRVPVAPRGLPSSQTATATSGGIGMRQIFQYQPDILSDASVLSTFAGAAVVSNDRVFKLNTAAS